jgi:hypothetical protein
MRRGVINLKHPLSSPLRTLLFANEDNVVCIHMSQKLPYSSVGRAFDCYSQSRGLRFKPAWGSSFCFLNSPELTLDLLPLSETYIQPADLRIACLATHGLLRDLDHVSRDGGRAAMSGNFLRFLLFVLREGSDGASAGIDAVQDRAASSYVYRHGYSSSRGEGRVVRGVESGPWVRVRVTEASNSVRKVK